MCDNFRALTLLFATGNFMDQRDTKIICTIGPATESYDSLKSLAVAGMDIARLNFSHGGHEVHLKRIEMIRKVSKDVGKNIKILQDLPGPKIRLGEIANEPLYLKTGSKVKIVAGEQKCDSADSLPLPYADFADAVYPGCAVYLWDGAIHLSVERVNGREVICNVDAGGQIFSRKGVNIPRVSKGLKVITEEDIKHIEFGLRNNVDYIALSFVRSGADIAEARGIMDKFGKSVPIVAKVEKQDALDNLEGIVKESDIVMVARGDMGVEIGVENVPMAQKRIIRECMKQGKPSITATQMLLSMVKSRNPTRAEVSDVANAILDGSDAVMLSEETAVGEFPADATAMLDKVSRIMEKELTTRGIKRSGWPKG